MTTGKIIGEPLRLYHSSESIGSTKLNVFHDSPRLFSQKYVAKNLPPDEPSGARDIGSAFDALRLEGEKSYAALVSVTDKWDSFRSKPAQTWRDIERDMGKIPFLADDDKLVRIMVTSAGAHPIIKELLREGQPQVTWRKSFGKFSVQCRTDWVNEAGARVPDYGETGPYFLEWKTTTRLSRFKKQFSDFGYHRQLVLYQQILREITGMNFKAWWAVQEKEPPYDLGIYELGNEPAGRDGHTSQEIAMGEILRDLENLKNCYENNIWPGEPANIQALDLPGYYAQQSVKRLTAPRRPQLT